MTRFEDHWVAHPTIEGRDDNHHKPIVGEISEEWCTTKYSFMQLKDGRVYNRDRCYWDQSPYGWNRVY